MVIYHIPGIRPGEETAAYLQKISDHLNLYGGSFLAFIAVFPYIMGKFMGQSIDFIISGAGLIIINIKKDFRKGVFFCKYLIYFIANL